MLPQFAQPQPPAAADRTVSDGSCPARCGGCGYRLIGLPSIGKCPECGEPYSPDELVLFGWGVAKSAQLWNARRGRAFLVVLSVFGWWTFQGVMEIVTHQYRAAFFILGISAIWATSGLLQRRRLLADSDAPIQLRLSSHGHGSRNGYGKVKLKRWIGTASADLSELSSGSYRLLIKYGLYAAYRSRLELSSRAFAIELDLDSAQATQVRKCLEAGVAMGAEQREQRPPG